MTSKIIIPALLVGCLLGNLVSIHLFGIAISPLDIIILLILGVSGYFSYRSGRLRSVINLPIVRSLLLFIGLVFLSLVFSLPALIHSPSAILISLLYALRLASYLGIGIILLTQLNFKSLTNYRKLLVWGGIIFMAIGLVGLALYPNFEIFDHLGWDPHHHRLLSSFLDPNYAGIWLGGILALVVLDAIKNHVFSNWFIAGSMLATAFLTLSRSGLLALAGIFSILGLLAFRKWFPWVVIVIVALAFLAPPIHSRLAGIINLDDTVRYRLDSWEGAVTIIKHHPLLGVGYNTLKFRRYEDALPGTSRLVNLITDGTQRENQTISRADAGFDSSLLTLFATTGILGLLAFLWWVWGSILSAWKAIQSSPNNLFNSWFLALTAGLFLSSWFVNAWFYPPILILWIISWALSQVEQQHA